MRRTRGAIGLLTALAIAGCGEQAAEIPFDSGPATSAPDTTTDLGGPLPSPAVSGGSIPTGSTDVPTTEAPATGPWVEATANLTGMESECGNLSFVATRPDADVVIAGVALRGLWANVGDAEEWAPLGQGAGSAEITNRLSAIVDDPEQPDTFYESGLYNGGGVYRTVDGGATFERLGAVTNTDLVSVDFTDPARATLLAGQHETAILERSTDGGATWTNISASLPPDIGQAAAPHVIDAQTHLLGTRGVETSAVLRTTDGGATWVVVHDGGVSGPVLPASDGALYWLLENGGGIISSTDDGATWTEVSGPGAIAQSAASLLELPDGLFATFTDSGILLSSDQGATWQQFGQTFPYLPAGIAYAPEREAFYIWKFDCDEGGANPVPADAIMRMDVNG